ncbi:MAG: hypothetical protein K1X54_12900 [Flavobacteriales bacterium]|nr:hypothetical protein [Flavobacteriales bacterium]
MKPIHFFALFAILLTSCDNRLKDFEAGAAFAGRVWGTKPAEIKLHEQDDHHPQGEIEINIVDLSLASEDQKPDDLASIAAMAFVQNVDPMKCNGFKDLSVNFNRSGEAHHSKFAIDDVRDAIELAVLVSEFLNTSYDSGIDGYKSFVDDQFLPDSVLMQYRNAMLQGDSIYGTTTMHNVTGMRFSQVKDSGEPVVIFHAVTHKDGGNIPLSFYVSRKSGKIISMGSE